MAINLGDPTTSIQNAKLNNGGDEGLVSSICSSLSWPPLVGRPCLRAFVHSFLLRVYLPVNQTRSPRGRGSIWIGMCMPCQVGGWGYEMGHTAPVIKNLLIVHTAHWRAELSILSLLEYTIHSQSDFHSFN